MPRPPRLVLPGIPHHITQRGNYRQTTYFRAEDYRLYLQRKRQTNSILM